MNQKIIAKLKLNNRQAFITQIIQEKMARRTRKSQKINYQEIKDEA